MALQSHTAVFPHPLAGGWGFSIKIYKIFSLPSLFRVAIRAGISYNDMMKNFVPKGGASWLR